MLRPRLLVCAALLAWACGAPADAPPSPALAAPGCHAELDAMAHCLHEVVTQIAEEPASTDAVASFLGHATWTIAAGHVHTACAPLGLTSESDALRLADGSPVTVTRSEELDHHDDGTAVAHIGYRFASPACAEDATTTLELRVGEPH